MAGRSIKPWMIRHTVVIAITLSRPNSELISLTELYEGAENAASRLTCVFAMGGRI